MAFIISATAQNVDRPSVTIDFDFLTNENQYNPWLFNYNTYSDVSLSEYSQSYDFDELKKFTAFLVFRNVNSGSIANFYSKDNLLQIQANKVVGSSEIPVNMSLGDSHILMYKGANGKRLKESLKLPKIVFESNDENRSSDENIYLAELKVFDKILRNNSIKALESALAIQYAIPLPVDSSYFSLNDEVIFKNDDNVFFNNVRAIGRNDDLGLYTTQVIGNREESFIALGLGTINDMQPMKSEIKMIGDNQYLFWTDNGKSLEFEEEGNKFYRSWKLSSYNFISNNNRIEISLFDFEREIDKYDYFIKTSSDENAEDEVSRFPISQNGNSFVDIHSNGEPIYFSIIRERIHENTEVQPLLNFRSPILINSDLKINTDKTSNYKMSITSIDGKQLLSKKLPDDKLETSQRFSMPGVYFITLNNGNTVLTKKLVVQ